MKAGAQLGAARRALYPPADRAYHLAGKALALAGPQTMLE